MERKKYTDSKVAFPNECGWYTEPGPRGIAIILHGSNASPVNNEKIAQLLMAEGYGIECPLIAGHGLGGACPQAHVDDLKAQAYEILNKARQHNTFCMVVGTSMGGTLALGMGLLPNAPDMIVTVSGALTCRPDHGHPWMRVLNQLKSEIGERLHEIQAPTLVLHDIDDDCVSYQDAMTIMDQVGSKRRKCTFYKGVGHSLMFSNYCKEMVEDIETFRKHLPVTATASFRYEGEAHEVFLAGEFNNWSSKSHPMHPQEDGSWSLEIELIPGSYPYKFVVDDNWILDPGNNDIYPAPNGEKNSRKDVIAPVEESTSSEESQTKVENNNEDKES